MCLFDASFFLLLYVLWSCVLFWRVFRVLGSPPLWWDGEWSLQLMVSEPLLVRTLDLGLRFILSGGVLGFGHRVLWFELALCEHRAGDRWRDAREVWQSWEDITLRHFFFFTVSGKTALLLFFLFLWWRERQLVLASLKHEQLSEGLGSLKHKYH